MPSAIETHKRLAQATARKLAKQLVPSRTVPPKVTLTVANGIHAGSTVELEDPEFTLGASNANDVMFLDDEILGGDVSFVVESSVFGPLLTAITRRDDLTMNGVSVPPGAPSTPESLPCSMSLNGIDFRVQAAGPPAPKLVERANHAALPLLVTAALVTFGFQAYLATRPEPSLILETRSPNEEPLLRNTAASEGAVREMLQQAGLDARLIVARSGEGTLSISGSLPSSMMPRWRALRSDIDHAAGNVVVVSQIQETPIPSDLPTISAVTLGADPRVVLANGSTLRLGDRISGDWTISEIGQDALALSRDGHTLSVSY